MGSTLDIEGHVLYALRNATIKKWPFPHFFVENVFPLDFYYEILHILAHKDDYVGNGTQYNGRKFGEAESIPELAFMNGERFLHEVSLIFGPWIKERFAGRKPEECSVFNDLRLVRDGKGYHIGPHTDAIWKIVSLLFYLPPEQWEWTADDVGTSIYMPKDPDFRCPGGPHHKFDGFDRIYTAPYKRNACFGFFKTNNSFHGVEPVDYDMRRDVLLFNIYDDKVYRDCHKPRIVMP